MMCHKVSTIVTHISPVPGEATNPYIPLGVVPLCELSDRGLGLFALVWLCDMVMLYSPGHLQTPDPPSLAS